MYRRYNWSYIIDTLGKRFGIIFDADEKHAPRATVR